MEDMQEDDLTGEYDEEEIEKKEQEEHDLINNEKKKEIQKNLIVKKTRHVKLNENEKKVDKIQCNPVDSLQDNHDD